MIFQSVLIFSTFLNMFTFVIIYFYATQLCKLKYIKNENYVNILPMQILMHEALYYPFNMHKFTMNL